MNIADGFRFLPFNVSFAKGAAAGRRKGSYTFSRGPIATAESPDRVRCHWLETTFFEIKLKILFLQPSRSTIRQLLLPFQTSQYPTETHVPNSETISILVKG